MKRKRDNFIKWMKAHKTELIIAGITVAGTVLLVKNRQSIKGIFKITESIASDSVMTEPVAKETIIPIISNNIPDNLTGNYLTARALGNKVFCSAQEINKRIVAAGFAVKLPCSEYMMTEAGHMLGKYTLKTTAAGHTFSNIEWDEKILELIFSPKELLDITAKQEQIRQILCA